MPRPCSHHVRPCIIHSCQCKLALHYSECAAWFAASVIRCRFAGRLAAPLSLCLLFSHSSAASAPIYWSITIPIRARTGRQTRFITGIAIADPRRDSQKRASDRVVGFAVSAAPSVSICTFYKPHGLFITQCLMCCRGCFIVATLSSSTDVREANVLNTTKHYFYKLSFIGTKELFRNLFEPSKV